jgi:hypothetical protein
VRTLLRGSCPLGTRSERLVRSSDRASFAYSMAGLAVQETGSNAGSNVRRTQRNSATRGMARKSREAPRCTASLGLWSRRPRVRVPSLTPPKRPHSGRFALSDVFRRRSGCPRAGGESIGPSRLAAIAGRAPPRGLARRAVRGSASRGRASACRQRGSAKYLGVRIVLVASRAQPQRDLVREGVA